MSSSYPGTLDSLTNPIASNPLSSPDHASQHTNVNDIIEAVESTLGTTAGTSVLKSFSAGDFPARINSSGVLQQVVSGTVNSSTVGTPLLTGGTVTGAVIGTNTITGGTISISAGTLTSLTINTPTVGTPAITGGTVTSGVINTSNIGTSTITGGTINSAAISSSTIGTSAISGGTIISSVINNSTIGTPAVTGGTATNTVLNINTVGTPAITGGTATSTVLNTNTVGTPAITGGTATSTVLNTNTIGTPTITGGSHNSATFGTPTLVIGSDATGDMFYRSAGGTVTRLGIGTSGQIITTNGTTPNWGEAASGGIGTIVAGSNLTGGTITSTGTISLAGTVSAITLGTSSIVGGTSTSTILNSNTIGTPTITGGSWGAATINSPRIGTSLLDSSGSVWIGQSTQATAVNFVTITNASTGISPQVAAGGETNVGLTIASKGSGTVRIYAGTGGTNGHVVPQVADDTFTLNAGTQTLTNKTISGGTVTTAAITLVNGTTTTDGGIQFDRTNEDLAIGDGSAAQLVHMGAWKSFTVSVTGFSSDPASMVGRYCLVGKMCTMVVFMPNAGTSNSTSFTVSTPFTSANAVAHYLTVNGQCTDNGAYYGAVFGDLPPNSSTITLTRNFGLLTWTASGGKLANFTLIYEIA